MQAQTQIIHSKHSCPLANGSAKVRYKGFKYPESQWAGLVDEAPEHVTAMTEIGRISIEAEGTGQLNDIEHQLLNMARIHGAHIVLIDFLIIYRIKRDSSKQFSNCVHISGRCQRFE